MQEQEQKPQSKTKRREVGQSLVEFALSALLLTLIFSGMIDLGRVYFAYVALEDSAGEAALFLSLYPNCVNATDCANPNNAEWRAENAVQGNTIDWQVGTNITINVTAPANASVGDTVEVEMTYDFPVVTPMIYAILGLTGDPTLELSVTAQQIVVSEG